MFKAVLLNLDLPTSKCYVVFHLWCKTPKKCSSTIVYTVSEFSFDWFFRNSCGHHVGVDMRNLAVMIFTLSTIEGDSATWDCHDCA